MNQLNKLLLRHFVNAFKPYLLKDLLEKNVDLIVKINA